MKRWINNYLDSLPGQWFIVDHKPEYQTWYVWNHYELFIMSDHCVSALEPHLWEKRQRDQVLTLVCPD